MNSRRMNRLEELGRVDAEKADTKKGARNLRGEKSRIIRELKADGGKVKPKRKKAGRPAASSEQRRMGRGAQGSRKKEISADNKRRIAVMDAAKETVTGGGMRADRFKEGLNIKGSRDSAMKYYARGDTDHGKLAQKNYEKMKNNTYAKGGISGKRSKIQDAVRAHGRDMQKTGRGKQFRKDTFVDSKTGRIVPDSPRNRKRYGKDIFGRDTGRVRATTAKGRAKKADGGSLKKVQPHQKGLKKLPTKVRNKMGYMKKGGRVGMGKAMRGGGCVR